MRAITVSVGVLLAFCVPAMAQKTLALPTKGIADSVGLGVGMIVPAKKWLPTRQQCLYPTRDLPVASLLMREVAYRPKAPAGFGLEAASVTLSLDVSVGPRAPRKRSNTFSLNHGKPIVRAFSGTIMLPKITDRTKLGWHLRIPFQKPVFVKKSIGPSLVLDFRTSSVVTKMSRRWGLIQRRWDTGTVRFQGIGYNCHFQKIRLFWQTFPSGIYVGGKTGWYGAPLLANQTGFLALGDAGWGFKWGGASLPFDLKAMGAPGCTWGIHPILFFPLIVDAKGLGTITTPIQMPNDIRLANRKMYTQGAYTFPQANPLGWLFLPSLQWRIGSGEDHSAAVIAGYTYNKVPPGKVSNLSLLNNAVPYCRITYN